LGYFCIIDGITALAAMSQRRAPMIWQVPRHCMSPVTLV
jgi:hypothetical protein